ncbi:hypothetical protein CVT24_004071 [Panaeolus cyanescens]|uniref:GIT Spa2 homology (SHD) domain-containing protein n=1 Tax=Panaeolus cyanescens TaxID=181874 RepID=A0A409Y5T7_9AGAR|nr:hypothetical protein CVT24_004071 [Panaeolus cyanescens]
MKRQPSRAPSPTPTAFSGISNYRADYKQSKDAKGAPAVPQIDYRSVSRTHYVELGKYLASYLAKAPPGSRTTARSKLTRLTSQQFHELSTDVYDELVRRKNEREVPFLPVKEEFHPKRNQARQKLATLPSTRFEDLSSDVYFELSRRYPEFKEDPLGGQTPSSAWDDIPAADYAPQRTTSTSRTSGRASADRPPDSGYGSGSQRRPSEDRRRPSEDQYSSGRRSEDTYRRQEDPYAGREETLANALASRRKPSQDTTRRSEDRERERAEFGRRPSQATTNTMASDNTATGNNAPSAPAAQSTTATSMVIIPAKSTMMEEEYIDIPYGRDMRESTTLEEQDKRGLDVGRDRARERDTLGLEQEPDSASEYPSPLSARSPPAGLGGLAARLASVEAEDSDMANEGRNPADDYFGRASVDSTRSANLRGNPNDARGGSRASVAAEETEKMKRDYEYKIARMQTEITTLQREVADGAEAERRRLESEARVRQLEDELASVRQRAEEQSSAMRGLQKELDELKELRKREAMQAQDDREELAIYRDRCMKLEEENEMRQEMMQTDPDSIEQLRVDMEGLLIEISDLSRRNDELMSSKDSDNLLIRELDNQLKDYKRKYEQAKTELRSVKGVSISNMYQNFASSTHEATSQLFLQAPKFDKLEDQLPMAPDGGILDIHITAFLSAIDSLLTAGRSNAPTRVLTPMKAVVNAVTNIMDDIKAFERRPQRDRADVDMDALRSLRDRAEATLSNLVAATKTHASASGMSPVSLLDAAASHVSLTITEIGRTVCIRRASKAEQDQLSSSAGSSMTGSTATNGYSPALRPVDESRGYGSSSPSSHARKGSQASVASSMRGRYTESPGSPPTSSLGGRGYTRRPPSANSSVQTNSPPPIFDSSNMTGGVSDDSGPADGSETDPWTELKPYLEAQTESIVYAIQSVLSGVRSPQPSPTLNENITQIITIVASIVAVCNDNLPPGGAVQGKEILKELTDQANKLSEVQASAEMTKESRQAMAKSSFAIANAMKGLTKL